MAFYGDLFLRGDQQGLEPEELTRPEWALAEELAMEWMARAASRSVDEKSHRAASRDLAQLRQTAGEEQGARSAARSAINGLAHIRWFAPFGMGFASRFVMRSLTQVTRYLGEEVVRAQAAVLASGGSEWLGRDAAAEVSQSEAMGGIQPSASCPVTASDFGPTEPVRIRGAGASAGSRPDTCRTPRRRSLARRRRTARGSA